MVLADDFWAGGIPLAATIGFKAGKRRLGGQTPADLGVEASDVALQGLEPAGEFELQEGGLAGTALVGQGGLVGDRGRAGAHQFLQDLQRVGHGGVRPRREASPMSARMWASIRSVLASWPMASANRRERSGLTTATT